MISGYFYQAGRYLILEDIGCWVALYPSWVEIFLNPVPCLIINFISVAYAILAFCAFRRIRTQGKDILSFHSGLTNSRYIRLMILGTTDAIFSTGIQIWLLVATFTDGEIDRFTSLKYIHTYISTVVRFSGQEWRSASDATSVEFDRWLLVICALLFFAFFGFSDEAIKHYRYAMSLVGSYVGVSTGSRSSSSRYVI